MMFDILIQNCCAVTMDPKRSILPRCSIAIKDGLIAGIGEHISGEAVKVIDAENCYVLPGLINCHTHVYQALLEGIGYDMHFNPWNIRFLIPLISNMGPEHARVSAEIAALEMIKSGTTTFSDHWYLHTDFENIEEVATGFDQAGIRNHSVFGFLNESFAGRKNDHSQEDVLKGDNDLLGKARDYVKRWHCRNLTTVALGPGSTEDVSRHLFQKIIKLAGTLDVSVVTHIAGWVEIVSRSLEKYQMRDLEYAHSLGFTGEKAIAIHGVWLSEEEIRIVAETGTKVVHNPVANMHLGYGIAPVTEMLARGVTVGLGSDGAASYTYDMFEIGKTAAMLQKVRKMDAEALTAEKALEMMTIDGAKVLGLETQIGSLEQGKNADLILIDAAVPHLMAGGRPVPKILYSAKGSDVITSIIHGRVVMENRKVLNLDEAQVMENAERMKQDLFQKAGDQTRTLVDAPWPEKRASWRMV